jgi:hypothetical protein
VDWAARPDRGHADESRRLVTWEHALETAREDVRAALGTNVQRQRTPLFARDGTELLATQYAATPWLVTDLVVRGGIAVIGAEPKAAKTWLGTEIALAIATGTKVCGEFPVQRGRVAYFYAEDREQQIRNRVRALLAGHDRTLQPNHFKPQPCGEFVDITSDEDLAWIVASVRQLGPIDLLVLDPLRDLHSGEEDKSDSMRGVMRRLRVLGELLRCTVLVVHHMGKPSEAAGKRRAGQRLRGSSAIFGAIDSGIYLTNIKEDGTSVFRNGVESQLRGARSAGRLEIELRVEDDENGEAVRAVYSVSRDVAEKRASGDAKNDEAKQRVLRAVREAEAGTPLRNKTAVRDAAGGNTRANGRAFDELIEAGQIARTQRGIVVGAAAT